MKLDNEDGVLVIQSGATLGDVYSNLHFMTEGKWAYGGGTTPSVGLTGHTLCVGYGPIGRLVGATMDQVLEFELMDASGKTHRASMEHNPDLFLALRGSCMSAFGIVTKLSLKLLRLPPTVTYITNRVNSNVSLSSYLLGELLPWSHADAPPEFTVVFGVSHGGTLTYQGQFMGNISKAREMLDPVLSKLENSPPFLFEEMTYWESAQRWAGSNYSEGWADEQPLMERRRRVCKAGHFESAPTERQWSNLYDLFQPGGVGSSMIKVMVRFILDRSFS